MPRLPGPREEFEQLYLGELEDFEAVFPSAFWGKDVGDCTNEEIESTRQTFFGGLEKVCGLELSQTVQWQIVEACRFFVARQYTRIPKNDTDSETGSNQVKKRVKYIQKIVGKFRDELKSEINCLRDMTGCDVDVMLDAGALPRRCASLEHLYSLFLDAFEGKPQTRGHMTVDQIMQKLNVIENRLGQYLDDINQAVASPNTIFRDLIFHLADAYEASGGDLYPHEKGQMDRTRQAFKAMYKTLFSAMPHNSYSGQSEAAIDKMVQTTLRDKAKGAKPSALSLAQQGIDTKK